MSAIEAVALSHIMAYGLESKESTGDKCLGGWGAILRVNEDREVAAAAPHNVDEVNRERDDDDEEQDDDDEGCRPTEVHVLGRDTIADLPIKEKALSEYSGHYDTALHRLQVALTWQAPDKSASKPSQEKVLDKDRNTKTEWLSLLKWKLLTILSVRPGMNLLSIHQALHLLDLPKTVELLDYLRTEGAITRSAAAITDRYPALRDPFSASQAIFSSPDTASFAGSNKDDAAVENWRYFVAV